MKKIRSGNVIWYSPGVKHWHGASLMEAMKLIALPGMLDNNDAWMEKSAAASTIANECHCLLQRGNIYGQMKRHSVERLVRAEMPFAVSARVSCRWFRRQNKEIPDIPRRRAKVR